VIIAGDILFIPKGGIIAAAGVSSLGYFVCALFSISIFLKQEKVSLKEILIIKRQDFNWVKGFISPKAH
jgi:hypothetical protein